MKKEIERNWSIWLHEKEEHRDKGKDDADTVSDEVIDLVAAFPAVFVTQLLAVSGVSSR